MASSPWRRWRRILAAFLTLLSLGLGKAAAATPPGTRRWREIVDIFKEHLQEALPELQ